MIMRGFLNRDSSKSISANNSNDPQEIIKKLNQQLIDIKEENERLKESNSAAIGARKSAVDKVRDLEDVLKLKETLSSNMERELTSSQSESILLSNSVSTLESQLLAIKLEQQEFPISNKDLLFRYNRLKDLFETIQESLTCPICYEVFAKEQAVSLLCGHTFCSPCFKTWEIRALEQFKNSSLQGRYQGAACPECRSDDVARGRVRIWCLEEIVRLVAKGTEVSKELYVPDPITLPSPTPTPKSADTEVVNEGVVNEEVVNQEVVEEPTREDTIDEGMGRNRSGSIMEVDMESTPDDEV